MCFYLWPFLPTYRSLINISCKAYLVVLNSSSICLFVKCLHSLSNLNDSHAKQGILSCRFFFVFTTLNISCYSLLACRVSAGKSATVFLGVLLCVINCFSLAAFLRFSLYFVDILITNMFWCGPLWADLIWDPLWFLDLDVCFLSQVREVFRNHHL